MPFSQSASTTLADELCRSGSRLNAEIENLLHGVPLGHPAHPPLTDVPVGCWMAATTLDLLPGTERASQVLLAVGLAGAVPVALTGAADWSSLHIEQQRVGVVHSIGTAAATGLFAASLLARLRGHTHQGKALGLVGLAALFGGDVVETEPRRDRAGGGPAVAADHRGLHAERPQPGDGGGGARLFRILEGQQ